MILYFCTLNNVVVRNSVRIYYTRSVCFHRFVVYIFTEYFWTYTESHMNILNDSFVLRKYVYECMYIWINTHIWGGLLNISIGPTKLYEFLIPIFFILRNQLICPYIQNNMVKQSLTTLLVLNRYFSNNIMMMKSMILRERFRMCAKINAYYTILRFWLNSSALLLKTQYYDC